MKYRLQQYEDGTFGYLDIDGNERYNFTTESPVVYTQGEDEDREDFIAKNEITFAKNQYGSSEELDKQVNDEDYDERIKAVKQGYGLDKLVNDKSWWIRKAIARQGYCLDILVNDTDWNVREVVAEQGYGLDILVNDEDYRVQKAVAKQGYAFDKFINDEDVFVRKAIAEHGYGLNKLINDENWLVREAVESYLKKENITLDEWKKLYPDKVIYTDVKSNKTFIAKCYWKFSCVFQDKDNNYSSIICTPQEALDNKYITKRDLNNISISEFIIRKFAKYINLGEGTNTKVVTITKKEIGYNEIKIKKCKDYMPPNYYLLIDSEKALSEIQARVNGLDEELYEYEMIQNMNHSDEEMEWESHAAGARIAKEGKCYMFTYTLYIDKDSLKEITIKV